jgi:hypothetical protein
MTTRTTNLIAIAIAVASVALVCALMISLSAAISGDLGAR